MFTRIIVTSSDPLMLLSDMKLISFNALRDEHIGAQIHIHLPIFTAPQSHLLGDLGHMGVIEDRVEKEGIGYEG